MTPEVLTVQADWNLDQLAEFLVEHGISGAPVIGEDEDVIGVVSLADIVRHRAEGSQETSDEPAVFFQEPLQVRLSNEDLKNLRLKEIENIAARELMTKAIFTVEEDTPVSEVAGAMVLGRVHRILVTKDSKISGIISSLDLLKLLMED